MATQQPLDDAIPQPVPTMPARDKRIILYVISAALDLISLFVGYAIALQVREVDFLELSEQPIVVFALPIFLMIALAREVHSAETLQSRSNGVFQSIGALGATALLLLMLTFVIDEEEVSRIGFAVFFGASAVAIALNKLFVDWLFKKMLGGIAMKTVVLCDGLECEEELGADRFDVGKFDVWPDPDRPDKLDMLARIVAPYDRVVVACTYDRRVPWASFLKGLDMGGEIMLDRDLLHGAVAIGTQQGRDTLVMSMGPLDLLNRVQKRVFDLIVAGIAVLVLSPLLLAVAIAIKLDSPGPVLFRQRRVGLGQRQFDILKFRSMSNENCDAQGNRSTGRDDDRITRVGHFIRRTSIDELPQLFNVLRGEMSMVGPRPHALGSRAGELLFWHASEYYWMRHALKPGLTGLAQVRGFRGSTETEADLQKRVRSDLEYLATWSLWGDVIIMLKTIRVVIHKNAF